MEVTATQRGFGFGEFKDVNDFECSIQDSSIATEWCIWFGVQDVKPQRMGENGLEPAPCPPIEGINAFGEPNSYRDVLFNARMHLTINDAILVAKRFKKFLKLGKVVPQTYRDRNNIKYSIRQGEKCIIIGCDDPNPQVCVRGWRPHPYPEGTIFNTKMHLGVDQVKMLLPVLTRFIETGTIHND